MKVAVVILNWNGRAMLERYLPTVMECSRGEATVFVADNASTDGSMDYVKANFDDCETIFLDENYGFADGYNNALRQVSADYYVLLNSDVEVTPHWLTPLVSFMDINADVAACQPKLLSATNKDYFEYAGAAGGYLDKYGYPFCRGRIFDTVERDDGQYDTVEEVMWATGACLMIRGDDYWRTGGLDGRFFAHNEEIDLCWRLRLIGKRVFCLPGSVVYHVGGGTLPKNNPMKTFLNFRNNLTMLYKNLPDDELRGVMRVRLVLDYVAALQSLLLKRDFGEFRAILKGRRAFKEWRASFAGNRAKAQAVATAMHAAYLKKYSVLWQYYARGRRRFGELP